MNSKRERYERKMASDHILIGTLYEHRVMWEPTTNVWNENERIEKNRKKHAIS